MTGAGGVFKQILVDTEAGKMMAEALSGNLASPFIFAFIVAGIIRIIQGSATVAMITAAGMTASLIASIELSDQQLALLVIAIASGATLASHVNDSGFWLVNRYLGLTEKTDFSILDDDDYNFRGERFCHGDDFKYFCLNIMSYFFSKANILLTSTFTHCIKNLREKK